jgi:pimeloyl-ACP methyl ester carboxylesterase
MRPEVISRLPESNAHPTPVLFVHGLWTGAWCWTVHFLDYFARNGYAAYAISLRGHGQSEGKERLHRIRLAEYVEDVEQVVKDLPAPPVLVGHSNGGAVVQKYLETHAAAGGVLMASVPATSMLPTVLRTFRHHPLAFLKANLTFSLYHLVATPALACETFFSSAMPDDKALGYYKLLSDESFLAFLDILALNTRRPERVKARMLVMGAEDDALFTPKQVRATAAAYHTEAIIFPHMGHAMMLEPGWQAVADRIIGWIGEGAIGQTGK